MDKRLQERIFWILVFLIILLLGYLVYYLNTESYECLENPLVYGIKNIESKWGIFSCTCSSPKIDPILITKDGISSLDNYNSKLTTK